MVELARQHAREAAAGAAAADRDARFPVELFASMGSSGLLTGALPQDAGGLGMKSVRDLVAVTSELARGDGSVSIATNMHLTASMVVARMAQQDATRAGAKTFMELIARGALICTANSEFGTDLSRPLSEARQVGDGWRVTGTKRFATLSQIANVFLVNCRIRQPEGDRTGLAIVLAGSEGAHVDECWDSLGMRASGSHDLVLKDCFVPKGMLLPGGPWGERNDTGPMVATRLIAGTGLLGSFLGIAQHARDVVLGRIAGTPRAEDVGVQHELAELLVALTSAGSSLSTLVDAVDKMLLDPEPAPSLVRETAAAVQVVKLIIQRHALETVDRAMTIQGGRSYTSGDPLGRLYRDVRASAFMQPFSPIEAYRYIGSAALTVD